MSKAYTLVELLLVVAIIAAIGSGVAVTYGKQLIDRSHDQMTQREMAEIKRAFVSFYADNFTQLNAGLTVPGSSVRLPTATFCSTFTGANAPLPGSAAQLNRLYGILEFFERYGLWCLMRPNISWKNRADDFVVFSDWMGPYLDAVQVLSCVETSDHVLAVATSENSRESDPFFPQVRTCFTNATDFYHVVYFEHCWNEADPAEPIYRRLLLVASSRPNGLATRDALLALAGNRRGGDASGYPLVRETGAIRTGDESRGLYFTELLNMDLMP